jgi:sulfate transport system substrate-binding protein
LAVVSSSRHLDTVTAFKNFQYTAAAQRLWAEAGFRPADPSIADEFRNSFPDPDKLWTIADLGGWEIVDSALFDKSTGSITQIYTRVTG